jgi:error-prone DNA polymerase
MDDFLRKRVQEGVVRRYSPKRDAALFDRARKQIEHELKLIARLGVAGYFLIVWDIVRFCKERNILIQGRGTEY